MVGTWGNCIAKDFLWFEHSSPQEEEANRIHSGSSVLHMLFLRLQVVQLHGVLLAACFDLHVNSEAANEFLLSDIFRIYLQLYKSEALQTIFALFTERQRPARSFLWSCRQSSEQ